jgi:hypothetical protein
MTWEGFSAAMDMTGISSAYAAFQKPQALPYLVYATLEEPDVMADNTHYLPVTRGFLELYAERKSPGLEQKVKSVFAAHGIPYRFDNEAWIESEKMNMTRWTFTFLGG